jgi:hypothetical protein
VNFTREPIIETVITPREGCKLVVRSSKGANQEDYFVDAVEVVSFGHSFFYRSLERPKSFLVPVSDYEILELKETRMVLKSAASERSIKIGGGREAPMRPREPEREESNQADRSPERSSEQRAPERPPMDRKRDNKRRRGRRGHDRTEPLPQGEAPRESYSEDGAPYEASADAPREPIASREASQDAPKAPSFISKLFPPPPTLIKDNLSRYKTAEPTQEGDLFPPSSEEPVTFEERSSDEESQFDNPIPPKNPSKDEQQNSEE